jgi:hypothetical protein
VAIPSLRFVAHALLECQELACPVRFAQRLQMLEDRQGARQIGTRLRYVSSLLMELAVAGVGERQFVLGSDLLQYNNAALEMGRGQGCLALGRVGRQGNLPQETVGRGKDKLHPVLLSGGEEPFEGLPSAVVRFSQPVPFTKAEAVQSDGRDTAAERGHDRQGGEGWRLGRRVPMATATGRPRKRRSGCMLLCRRSGTHDCSGITGCRKSPLRVVLHRECYYRTSLHKQASDSKRYKALLAIHHPLWGTISNIDKTPPAVAVTGVTNDATYILGSVPAAGCVTTDALFGVQTSAALSVMGGNANGVGTFTASYTGATDKAGNPGAASVTYQVKSPPLIVFSVNQLRINQRLKTFFLLSGFTLSESSNGISPVQETVTLTIATFTTTIPAHFFRKGPAGVYVFAGQINNVWLEALITPLGNNRFGFQAAAYGAGLNGTKDPVTARLTIGDDSGTTSVNAVIR